MHYCTALGGHKKCGSTDWRLQLQYSRSALARAVRRSLMIRHTLQLIRARPRLPRPVPARPATGAVAMAPITGTTKTVNMVGDAQGYRFEPANFTVKQGDGVKFVVVSGPPHNVAFDPATIPPDVRSQLDANMGTDKMGELSSSMKMNPGESITVSFANIKPGQYPYHCTPHLALNMKGVITVQ